MRITSLVGTMMILPSVAFADVVDNSEAVKTDELFVQCAKTVKDSARLACFDALMKGETPAVLTQKRPVHLSSTIISTLTGNPQVVQEDPSYKDQLQMATGDATVLTEIGLPKESIERYTPLSLAYDLDKNSERGLWSARPHNANYILPMYFNAKPNRHPTTPTQESHHYTPDEMRAMELKFQVSLKTKAVENLFGTDADLWLGYTQQSHWQVYNEDYSRPFRVHDYEPEIFLTQPVSANLPFGGKLRMLGAGAVHHSNGESDPLSRSWNRMYLMGGAEWDRLTIVPRVWTRLSQKEGSKPDDNPDIIDYYGYGDVKFLYQLQSGSNVSGLVRFNPKTKKGGIQLDYVKPLSRGVSGYVQVFHGHGQSLVDYNKDSTSVGVGVMLTDWMGL